MYYLTFTHKNGISDTIPYRSLAMAKRAVKFYESIGSTATIVKK